MNTTQHTTNIDKIILGLQAVSNLPSEFSFFKTDSIPVMQSEESKIEEVISETHAALKGSASSNLLSEINDSLQSSATRIGLENSVSAAYDIEEGDYLSIMVGGDKNRMNAFCEFKITLGWSGNSFTPQVTMDLQSKERSFDLYSTTELTKALSLLDRFKAEHYFSLREFSLKLKDEAAQEEAANEAKLAQTHIQVTREDLIKITEEIKAFTKEIDEGLGAHKMCRIHFLTPVGAYYYPTSYVCAYDPDSEEVEVYVTSHAHTGQVELDHIENAVVGWYVSRNNYDGETVTLDEHNYLESVYNK